MPARADIALSDEAADPSQVRIAVRGEGKVRHMSCGQPAPAVSVLMPTYRQAAFLPRALTSLLAQSFQDWELIVIDDGSPDNVEEIVNSFKIPRLKYVRLPQNQGLGKALNVGAEHAQGRYLAYLPSDDLYSYEHLSSCVALLDKRPEVFLAYGGVSWFPRARVSTAAPLRSATLREDIAPGGEADVLAKQVVAEDRLWVPSGNFLALAQVVHRREDADLPRWAERSEMVSDSLELDYWKTLLAGGRQFAYTGQVTCEWGDHPDQRHKIISGRGMEKSDWRNHSYGLSRYRQFYDIPPGDQLNWRPVAGGFPVDERDRYQGIGSRSAPPQRTGLKILLVGALSFNPERIVAFEEQGHQLYGMWMPNPHFWDTAGPLPFGHVENIKFDREWRQRVAEIAPDVVYALLNWHVIPFLYEVFSQRPDVPFVFHFKESPFAAMQAGCWQELRELVLHSDGVIFSSIEEKEWFSSVLGTRLGERRTMVFDGDPPKNDWMTADWADRLSDIDNEPHTVCVGRVLTEPLRELADRGIHIHVYTHPYMQFGANWRNAASTVGRSHVHFHDPIAPKDWVRELSQYDAGWLHTFSSTNNGQLHECNWDDLNVPARASTYALAGLPWLMRENSGHRVAVQTIANEYGIGVNYRDLDDLANRLKEECDTRDASIKMRRHRHEFTMDHHVDRLVTFMRSV